MIRKTENGKVTIHLKKEGERGIRWEDVAITKTIHLILSLFSSLPLKCAQPR